MPCVFVLNFREQFSFPAFLVGNHICTIRYPECMCVCETHLKDSVTPSVLVLIFREQFMPVGRVLSFPENSFMPVGSVLSFPENS